MRIFVTGNGAYMRNDLICTTLLFVSLKPETHMNHPLYEYSLCIALLLMILFGSYFLLARTPDKEIFANYLRSRRIMGFAILLLASNYFVHLLYELRFHHIDAAILMNLSTYFLCYWLFSSALTTLLDRFYITRRRFASHFAIWVLFTLIASLILLWLPEGLIQKVGLIIMAGWLFCYGFWLARRLIRAYRRAVKLFDDTHSDNIAAYIRWLSIFTYWAVIYGVGCGLLTFLPDRYIFLWILSSVPFYIYLYCSYLNYLLLYERVEQAFETEIPSDDTEKSQSAVTCCVPYSDSLPGYADIATRLGDWIASDGYIRPGITIKELSDALHTNRTYLSGYIKTVYNLSFREWISDLRVEYAKEMLIRKPELTIHDVSGKSGFLSPSHFMRTFKEHEACSPARWRRIRLSSMK